MKNLFKQTRVIYDAHLKRYDVEYKNFLFWKYDSCYKYDDELKNPVHYETKKRAEERAIERASAMLDTVVVWQKSNIYWYY